MVTEVEEATGLVVTVNVVDIAPAGTVRLAGTVAVEVCELVRVTYAPEGGAAPVRITVFVVSETPPTTLAAVNATFESSAGVTVSVVFTVVPL